VNGRNWAERVRNRICITGGVEADFDMIDEGIQDSLKNKRYGAMAQLLKIKMDVATKLYEVEERTKAETADKTLNVNMLWAQPKREIE